MPTPAFCALNEVYADWNNDYNGYLGSQAVYNRTTDYKRNTSNSDIINNNTSNKEYSNNNLEHGVTNNRSSYESSDIRSFCPNCTNCLNKNDQLQQQIIQQNVWPRPRWTPQSYPEPYSSFDPFNRYWYRENFENRENFGNNISDETLLQVVLFLLISLFIIQIIDMVRYA